MSGQEKRGNATIECATGCGGASGELSRQIVRLQLMILVWMLVECALALVSASRTRSPVLLAFGADSFIELLSALVVILQFVSWSALPPLRAARFAGVLLFALATVVTMSSSVDLWHRVPLSPDLPLLFSGSPKVGLGLYNSVSAAKATVLEVGMLLLGTALYVTYRTKHRRAGSSEVP